MKDFMICVLATLWVLEVIYWMGRRRHPRVDQDHIDDEWRDLVRRQIDEAHHGRGPCPVHGPTCIQAIRAVRTGFLQRDEDAGRRVVNGTR